MIKNLKSLRTEKGLSQQQLASVIGISQQSINKYENHNVEPDISTLIDLADYFETTVDFLIGRNDTDSFDVTFELSKNEVNIIRGYRRLNKTEQTFIDTLIKTYNNVKKSSEF